jgi:hypothetical protein
MKKVRIKNIAKGTLYGSFWLFIGIAIYVLIYGLVIALINNLTFATGIMAIATLVLAFFTYWNIRNSNEQTKRNRKEHLLSELSEWAIDVASSFEPVDTPDLSDDKNAAKSWPFLADQRKKLNSLQLLGIRGLAMCMIAGTINSGLKVTAEHASQKLEKQQSCLWEFKRWEDTRPKNKGVDTEFLRQMAETVSQNNSDLYGSAIEVIRDATDLRSATG